MVMGRLSEGIRAAIPVGYLWLAMIAKQVTVSDTIGRARTSSGLSHA
jgi:hypothetical protein